MTPPKLEDRFQRFYLAIQGAIPVSRLITDPLRTLAYGTDASFYRLTPKIVVKAETEAEVVTVLKTASNLRLPVTFRAAGTSLSGQAVTDSILLVAGAHWKSYAVMENGAKIRLQPGIIGAQGNSDQIGVAPEVKFLAVKVLDEPGVNSGTAESNEREPESPIWNIPFSPFSFPREISKGP